MIFFVNFILSVFVWLIIFSVSMYLMFWVYTILYIISYEHSFTRLSFLRDVPFDLTDGTYKISEDGKMIAFAKGNDINFVHVVNTSVESGFVSYCICYRYKYYCVCSFTKLSKRIDNVFREVNLKKEGV